MENEIDKFLTLLRDFSKLPKTDTAPTFMEICKYPYNRFEEICSRILQFFFNPKAEHGFGNMWLSALLDIAGNSPAYCDTENVRVITEENADGKRIDLTIVSDNFVVGIENKTTAEVYNPLHLYKNYIRNTYKNKSHLLLVLSIKPVVDTSVRKKLETNNFKSFTYRELFHAVKKKLGGYIAGGDQKYLTYMLDFMKTIEHMDNSYSKMENDFFFENRQEIEELITRFARYKEAVLSQQKEQIAILQQRINDRTQPNWWVWQGWDLGISFNDSGHRIGIESSYEASKDAPCAVFHIYITTWKMKDWFPYKEAVLSRFPGYTLLEEYKENRSYLHLPVIEGNDHEKIVETLKETFDAMTAITSKIK